MKFAVIKNIRMFAAFNANEQTNNFKVVAIFVAICKLISSRYKAITPCWAMTESYSCSLARMGGDSLSLFHKIKFSPTMPTNDKICKGTNNSSPSTTPISAKTASKNQSKLEKEIIAIQNKVAKLQAECDTERAEKYRLLCYIDRYCSALLSYFTENNPLDSQDWKKLHKQHLDLRDAIK